MGKRSEVVFGNRMSSQVVKKAENSKERFVKRFGDDSDVDYPLAVVKNPYIGDTLGVSNIVIDGGVSDDIPDAAADHIGQLEGLVFCGLDLSHDFIPPVLGFIACNRQ